MSKKKETTLFQSYRRTVLTIIVLVIVHYTLFYLVVPGMAMARIGSATLRWYGEKPSDPQLAPAE